MGHSSSVTFLRSKEERKISLWPRGSRDNSSQPLSLKWTANYSILLLRQGLISRRSVPITVGLHFCGVLFLNDVVSHLSAGFCLTDPMFNSTTKRYDLWRPVPPPQVANAVMYSVPCLQLDRAVPAYHPHVALFHPRRACRVQALHH